MSAKEEWKEIVASSLDWEQAHMRLESVLADLPGEMRTKKPAALPHSVWDILEHIRIAQHDLLDFCTNPNYSHDLDWPGDYWPKDVESVSDEDWEKSLAAFRKDCESLKEFTKKNSVDLTAAIPWGTGQTFLRTVLVSVDHTSYHSGEIVAVRRLLGAWPPG